MPRSKSSRRPAPRDAFIGVREGAPDSASKAPSEPSVDSSPPPQEAAEAAPVASADTAPSAKQARPAAKQPSEAEQLRELAKALQTASPGFAEKLTIYLSADLSEALKDLWEKTRKQTGVKLGKATIVQAALALVLRDPELRIKAVEEALRAKIGASVR